jgi:hypothetical protein
MKVFFLEIRYTHVDLQDRYRQNELYGTNVFLSLDDAQIYVEDKAKYLLKPSHYQNVIELLAIIYNAEITSLGIVQNEIISVKGYNKDNMNNKTKGE